MSKEKLKNKRVLIVGLGGVGSYTAEILARNGIEHLYLVDADSISITNINRQLPALPSTVGKDKIDIVKERLLRINPNMIIETKKEFLSDEKIIEVINEGFDYVVDAIDSISPKIYLIKAAIDHKIPVVSSMGAGGRFDPTKVCIDDISNSNTDSLTRIVRYRLHKFNIRTGFKCVYSSEEADKAALMFHDERFKKSSFGTLSYMTSIFGIKCAEVVINDLLK